jgi:hypothetical protein
VDFTWVEEASTRPVWCVNAADVVGSRTEVRVTARALEFGASVRVHAGRGIEGGVELRRVSALSSACMSHLRSACMSHLRLVAMVRVGEIDV